MMTQEEQRLLDLDIEVTPEVEDAFYFLKTMEIEVPDSEENESVEEYEERLAKLFDPGIHAGNRIGQLDKQAMLDAIGKASRMIENIEKYGIPCLKWGT